MRRGGSAATYRFPQLPAIDWRVDDLGCGEFAAAVAQERRPVFSTLTDLADDYDIIADDLRNHGWNSASSMQNHNLPTLVHDHDVIMEAVDAHYGEKPKVGVFHSISALTTLLFANLDADFAAGIPFDPPLCKAGRSLQDFEEVAAPGRHDSQPHSQFRDQGIARRAAVVPPPCQRMKPGVRDLFPQTTLRDAMSGDGYELRCPREYEAQMIEWAGAYAVLVDFDSLLCPTKVIGADTTLPCSYLPTLDLRDVFTVSYDFLPESTHLLQLEQPGRCAALVREFLQEMAHA